ncbi:MAG: thermonuclease family protein [Oscillospiraceae bacterium]|nr:thermonuclease family protein [Oscillospiraceae bacterium]
MKKLCSFFLAILLLATTAGAVDLYVDDSKIEVDVPPVVVDGRTLVPVRAIFEAIGATVEWDGVTNTAIGVRDGITVQIQINNTTAYVNGEARTLDVPAQLINNRTMVPARFISEAMGCDVTWDQATQTVGVAYNLKGISLYATPTGEKYHYDGSCNGGNYYQATLAEIRGRNLTPCDKCVLTNQSSVPSTTPSTGTESSGNYTTTVLRVVDGDTIVVNYNGVEEKVRLIGIDTPESVHPDNSKNTDAGFAASEFTKAYLTGEKIELEFDVQQRDQYGRLLAYVYFNGEMFNEKLLRTGYANIATYPPNVKYVDRFTEIVSRRDSSIPSGEYCDGYMKAPEIIYTTPGGVGDLKDAFLYEDGIISDIGTYEDSNYMVLSTRNGNVYCISFHANAFDSLHVGDSARIGFIYLGNTSSNSVAATYLEMLLQNPLNSDFPNADTSNTGATDNSPSDSPYQSTVYVSNRSNTIHSVPDCGGMKNYREMSREEADSQGYKYCPNCW